VTGTERISYRSRSKRMLRFLAECRVTHATSVLDVGGNPAIWLTLPEQLRPRVTFVNMPRAAEPGDDREHLVFADGGRLPFGDRSFDVAFSNSVIEHVGSRENQQRFAGELRRVGRICWVQTPSRFFPVEQHLLTPFVHWLPFRLRAWIVRRWTVWGSLTHPTQEERQYYVEHFLEDIRLLGAKELVGLFPGCRLIRERTLGWTRSLIATTAAL
jgi:hypothetical protein